MQKCKTRGKKTLSLCGIVNVENMAQIALWFSLRGGEHHMMGWICFKRVCVCVRKV